MKRNIFVICFLTSLNAYAFSDLEWTTFINESIIKKSDSSWGYDINKLKEHVKRIKSDDLIILENISNGSDMQLSQASKYLLATQGDKTNTILFNNYLADNDIINGLYYLNLNFINTPDKNSLWSIIDKKSESVRELINEDFKVCKDFNDYYSNGGKEFTFENYNDFFDQRKIVQNYTNADLFTLELDIADAEYPLNVVFFDNKYVVQKPKEDKCLKTEESIDYIQMQKIMALYKQYKKNDKILENCEMFDENKLLKSRFSYFCLELKK